MRTRQRDRDVPGPSAPWNEIVPGLWMGGHWWLGPEGIEPAVVRSEFDTVVSLVDIPGHGPDPQVAHHCGPVPDGPLSPGQIDTVIRLAGRTAEALRSGRTVLVRCHSGYNRSGLVTARALVDLGHGTEEAVELIRRRRSPWALHNRLFVDYLGTGLETALLLTGLGPD
ncbi:protein phosphatase [Kitasatospora paranensis]|uniref:Protein phosphatase n=1 Tax=Kitasatospora paranensis TaxID=258053 RepID=A0ABW2FNK9_9ACTN